MISHFCVWRMCKRGAWIFPTICTKIQARNLKLKIFSNSAIVGCNSGRGRRGGSDHNSGRGQRDMDAHTHTVPCNTRCAIFTKGQPPIRHPCYHLLCTVSAPLCLLDSHITLNRVALQSSWHGPNEFKWSPPLSPTLSYSPSAGEVLILLSLVWWKPLFDNCLMRL